MSLQKNILFALLTSTFLAMPAMAADAVTALQKPSFVRRQNTPVIVVTPTKSSRDINQIPYAVSVIDSDTIEQTQPQSFDDAMAQIPNFDSAGGNRTVTEEPSLRGLSDRRLAIKIDGIRRNFRAQYAGRYFVDPMLINRIEVVRGSNSSIDGSGAMGGTIQLFTTDTLNELRGSPKNWGAEMRTGFESNNQELSTAFAGYGMNDKIDIYAAGSSRRSDDYHDGNGSKIASTSAQPTNALVKAGYSFSPTHRAEIRVARFFDTSELPVSPFQPVGPQNAASERESGVTDYSFKYRLAPDDKNLRQYFDVTSIVYRSEYKISSRRLTDNRLDQTFFNTTGTDTYNTATVDAFGLKHKLTTGVEYFTNDQSGLRNGALRALLGDGEDQNLGLYLQQETTLFDRLTIIPGVRFDKYELTPGNASLPSQSRDNWSPKIGANYKFNDAVSAYGSLSTAFRTPTLTELYSTGTIFPGNTLISNPYLIPETALNKELGVRYGQSSVITANDNLNVKVSVFENQIDDYIEQVIGATTTQFRNVAQALLRGYELEANYRIQNYNFIASGGAVRGYNEANNDNLSDVPADRYALAAERYFMEGQFKAGTRATFHAAQNKIPTGQPSIVITPSAMTYDVYSSWTPDATKDGSFRIDAGIDNITDKNYRRHLAFIPEMGRNAKVTMNWKF